MRRCEESSRRDELRFARFVAIFTHRMYSEKIKLKCWRSREPSSEPNVAVCANELGPRWRRRLQLLPTSLSHRRVHVERAISVWFVTSADSGGLKRQQHRLDTATSIL